MSAIFKAVQIMRSRDWLKDNFGRLLGAPLFIVMVLMPTLIYGTYVSLIESDSYQSQFRIQVRSNSDNFSPSFGAMLGLVGGAAHASSNGYAVVQYLESADAVRDLEGKARLRGLYDQADIDYLSRLRHQDIEDVIRYWRKHLNAYYETTTDTLVVEVSAYRADDALHLANTAQELSERLLNQMSERSRRDAVAYAQQEVADAEQRLNTLDVELLKLRNNSQTIDPAKQFGASLVRIGKLQELVDQAQADLTMRRRYLAGDSPSVQLSEAKLRTLRASLAEAENEVAGKRVPDDRSLAGVTYRFEQMEAQKVFAERRLQAALAGLTSAQNDAIRQQLYLNTIVRPHLAERPTSPRPLRDISLFGGVALGLWMLLTMILHSVRDHIIG